MMTRQLPVHPVVPEHELSRSYQPSTTGIAAYYQVFFFLKESFLIWGFNVFCFSFRTG